MNLLMRLKPCSSPFFEDFNFSVCLDTVGYFLHNFESNLTVVFCVDKLIFHSLISFSVLVSFHYVAKRPLPVT